MLWPLVIACCCLSQTEAAITLAQIARQHEVTSGSLLRYNIANDELHVLESQQQAAWNRWQALSGLAVLFYSAGDYQRGDMMQSAAVVEQAEYNRVTALLPAKRADVENAWQSYLREYERLNAMLMAYRNQ